MWARGEGAWGMGRSRERWLRREERKGGPGSAGKDEGKAR